MAPLAQFASSYVEARRKFQAAALARDLAVDTHELPGLRGIDGEALAMDVARLGAPDATGMLVLTSATHGIEGYCGSGCQVGLLHDEAFLSAVRDARVAVLFVHAVNPHGFSWGRRVNEDNVDLNRNFHDVTQPLPVNAAYAELHPLLLPATWPPPQDNEARIGAYVALHGMAAFQQAVSGGQYAFPDGLFYGGQHATWSNRMLRTVLRSNAMNCERLGWIDFHTGLGPRGHGEMIHAGRDLEADLARARRWWGEEVTSLYDGSSASAVVGGIVTAAAYDECPGAELATIGLEYGTVPLPEVFAALRIDHWLHNHPDAPEGLRAEARRKMRAAFFDEATDWKLAVYAQARTNALKAVLQLAKRNPPTTTAR
jgi:hypothetical protein